MKKFLSLIVIAAIGLLALPSVAVASQAHSPPVVSLTALDAGPFALIATVPSVNVAADLTLADPLVVPVTPNSILLALVNKASPTSDATFAAYTNHNTVVNVISFPDAVATLEVIDVIKWTPAALNSPNFETTLTRLANATTSPVIDTLLFGTPEVAPHTVPVVASSIEEITVA